MSEAMECYVLFDAGGGNPVLERFAYHASFQSDEYFAGASFSH